MKPLHKKWSINIEISNECQYNCAYCTRYVRHLPKEKIFKLSIEQFENILKSLKGWPTLINFFGGEPTIHPLFKEFCELALTYFPKRKLQLFTAGGYGYDKHKEVIDKTFKNVYLNPHIKNKEMCYHQPLTIALNDVVKETRVKRYLMDNCWAAETWCGSIYSHGVYFCEMAGSLDWLLFDGKNANELKPKFWKQNFEIQRFLCGFCGMCIPMKREKSGGREVFSRGLYELLKFKGLKFNNEEVVDKIFTLDEIRESAKTWCPGNFRGDKNPDELSSEGLGIKEFKL